MQSNIYEGKTIRELKSIAKYKNIKGASSLRKNDLIERLNNHDATYHPTEKEEKEQHYICLTKDQLKKEIANRGLNQKSSLKKKDLINILIDDDSIDKRIYHSSETIECCVCFDEMPNIMVTLCNHPVCKLCIPKLSNKTCPICRRALESPYTNYNILNNINKEISQESQIDLFLDCVMANALSQLGSCDENTITMYVEAIRDYAASTWIDQVGGLRNAIERGFDDLLHSFLTRFTE